MTDWVHMGGPAGYYVLVPADSETGRAIVNQRRKLEVDKRQAAATLASAYATCSAYRAWDQGRPF